MPATPAKGSIAAAARPLKRSFAIKGHRTSISMEGPFWAALEQAAEMEESTLTALIADIDAKRGGAGLSSAVRVWVLDYFRRRALPPR